MSDNAFSADEWREGFRRCTSTEDVLWKFRAVDNAVAAAHAPDALARIAELSPPKDENLRDHAEHILRVHGLLNPTPRTVDEAGRERAQTRLAYWLRERGVSTSGIGDILDRIIDALGWAAAEPEPQMTTDEYGRAACVCGYVPPTHTHADDCPVFGTQARTQAPTPAPATPAVELTPNELRSAAAIVEAFRELHTQTCQLNYEAIDAVPSTWPLPIIDAQLPVAVACGEADWVLRIGGDQ